jgi:putative oxygen-independent coproporphyrinogen III oxidase
VRKCPYCDFNSHSIHRPIPEIEYMQALLADLEQFLPQVAGREIISIFIGGGTPSLFAVDNIDYLLTAIANKLIFAPDIEITLEANVGTIDKQYIQTLRQAGVNRLSLGIQSFNDNMLSGLGRIHNQAQAITALTATARFFDNFNLDLMFGLMGQTATSAIADLKQGLKFCPSHLSWYQLSLEPHTPFYHRPPPDLPNEDQIWQIQQAGMEFLTQNAYANYEISAYHRQDKNWQCKHNVNYWQFGDYLGIGAGAHSKLTQLNQIHRYSKQINPAKYMQTAASSQVIAQQQILSPTELPLEFMLNALRLKSGFSINQFTAYTGLNFKHIEATINIAIEHGWLARQQQHIWPTATGQQFLNDLLLLFIPDKQ